ncbi:hypothetical protein BU23DRAFT_564118 [Bimuria novae-zelandiae CBS 107.79]|uniref:Uncharacterized protein n=1 Tax=Bimuria novae-zelandiae CBS 107.79 TaxID=1447943 RepID=A0A6A5VPM5_9PLEO|nr:hypothetical protein BU23DRAFT_564118 [Bimuria novae-zelandiae CBS 107.79]
MTLSCSDESPLWAITEFPSTVPNILPGKDSGLLYGRRCRDSVTHSTRPARKPVKPDCFVPASGVVGGACSCAISSGGCKSDRPVHETQMLARGNLAQARLPAATSLSVALSIEAVFALPCWVGEVQSRAYAALFLLAAFSMEAAFDLPRWVGEPKENVHRVVAISRRSAWLTT